MGVVVDGDATVHGGVRETEGNAEERDVSWREKRSEVERLQECKWKNESELDDAEEAEWGVDESGIEGA